MVMCRVFIRVIHRVFIFVINRVFLVGTVGRAGYTDGGRTNRSRARRMFIKQ